jgi:stage II sporulation protein D
MQQGPIPGSSINNNDNPNLGDDHPVSDQPNNDQSERSLDPSGPDHVAHALSENGDNVTDGDSTEGSDNGGLDDNVAGSDDSAGDHDDGIGGPGDSSGSHKGWPDRWWIYGAAIATALVIIFVVSSLRKPPQQLPEPQQQPTAPKMHGPMAEPTVTVYDIAKGGSSSMKLEDYVAGVVAGEVDNTWPIEAIKTQAIVARTFALQSLEANKKSRYGTTYSSDFNEFAAYKPQQVNNNIKAAVTATRGLVLTYNGKAIHAFFHSTSGGITATAPEGLGFVDEPTPYLQVVADGPVSNPTEQSWQASFAKSQIASMAGVSSFSTISIGQRGPSGRAVTIKVGNKDVKAIDMRMRLGSVKFRSTLIDDIRIEGDKVVFKGRGWGHGVGLSQWGAHDRALKGQTCRQILSTYFPAVTIEQLWK